jgi:hypothetical protein
MVYHTPRAPKLTQHKGLCNNVIRAFHHDSVIIATISFPKHGENQMIISNYKPRSIITLTDEGKFSLGINFKVHLFSTQNYISHCFV